MKHSLFLLPCIFILVFTSCAPAPREITTQTATATTVTASWTKTPTATPSPPRATSTSTPVPAEIDIHPMTTLTAKGELLGVKNIITNVIADQSLSNSIGGIEKDNSYKDFDKAMTEFTARLYYDLAVTNGGPDGNGLKIVDSITSKERTPTFEEYMQMAVKAQSGEGSYADIQFTIPLNDIATEGYVTESTVIWPFYEEVEGGETPPDGVRVISEFSIPFYRSGGLSIKNHHPKITGLGSNILGRTLYLYKGVNTSDGGTSSYEFIAGMTMASRWLSSNTLIHGFPASKMLILSNDGNSDAKFRSIIRLIDRP